MRVDMELREHAVYVVSNPARRPQHACWVRTSTTALVSPCAGIILSSTCCGYSTSALPKTCHAALTASHVSLRRTLCLLANCLSEVIGSLECSRRSCLCGPVQKQHSPLGAGLHPGDTLYIVHVHSPKQGGTKRGAWQMGGALMHNMQVCHTPGLALSQGCVRHFQALCMTLTRARMTTQDALEQYPHTTVELTGSNVTAATLDWAEGEGVHILVMGELLVAPWSSISHRCGPC
jgi:hypothetical protein